MNSASKVRTRFAPSPTGYLHVGGARTALYNWLFAKQNNGDFILRVEDTDKERNTEASLNIITENLSWLGLDWDEGPNKEGSVGPYFQSQRNDIYDSYFEKLVQADRVYEQDGAWWFRFERKPITFQDAICGEITIDYRNEDNTPDMAIKRSDGSYVFHFVNVVDDLTMEISHVLRGEDHLMNTPKHLQLFEALGETPPVYGHIPLILNQDGSKMSKSSEGASVHEYAETGFLSEAVLNFFALLGWSSKSDEEIFSLNTLVEKFSLDGINRAPAKFDMEKCLWMNQQHLMNLEPDNFAQVASSFLNQSSDFKATISPELLTSVQEKIKVLSDIAPLLSFLFSDDFSCDEKAKGKLAGNDEAIELLTALADKFKALETWSADAAKEAMKETAKDAGLKVGKIMLPCRIALSGMTGGIDLGVILETLGKDSCVSRLLSIKQRLS